MDIAIKETNRRRSIQEAYNIEHNITPKTIVKPVRDLITTSLQEEAEEIKKDPESMTKKELEKEIKALTKKMNAAAADLNFEMAAVLRDELKELKIALQEYDD